MLIMMTNKQQKKVEEYDTERGVKEEKETQKEDEEGKE